MCDSDYSGDEDNLHPSQIVTGKGFELRPLTFTGYEICGDKRRIELGVPLAKLAFEKFSLVRDDLTLTISIFCTMDISSDYS